MPKLSIQAGSTSQSVNIFISDSSSTVGLGLSGLAYNSAGLTAYYSHAGANATANAITLATLAAVNSAWSSGGFKEIDATNMKGWYRFDIPDAVLAASKGRSVAIHLKGATNMAPLPIEIELTGWDNQDAVRGGMTALPNANAAASGGLMINGSNTGTVTFAALTVTGAFTVSDGIIVTCTTSNRSAIQATGNGTGHGGIFKSGSGGATGSGIYAQSQATAGHGIIGVATGTTGNGIYGYGGTSSGNGIKGQGGDAGGYGIEATAASGAAIHAQSTSGYGFEIVAGSGNNSAVKLTPAGTGYGINGTLASVVTVSGNVTGSVGSVTGAVGSVTGNVGGNLTGSVGSVATGGITAASFAASAIDAAALAADAVAEIQSGLSTLTTGDIPTAAEIDTHLSLTHGAGSWATATGFAVAGDAMALTTSERASVADKVLNRNINGGGDGTRTVEEALAVLRNKSAIVSGTLTVYDTDDTTPLWTATITSSASADPITGVDPA